MRSHNSSNDTTIEFDPPLWWLYKTFKTTTLSIVFSVRTVLQINEINHTHVRKYIVECNCTYIHEL
jgi:hypothetical protein